jgi:hypothetical protein
VPAVVLVAAETSKVPWFIAGGVLALYAVILAAIGLRNPEFPFNLRGQRLVMLVTFVLVVIAIGAAISTG